MGFQSILDLLPYSHPFLFVDTLKEVTNETIQGTYTFKEDSFFYKGHFKDHPVTPGVILTECMAQIGVVCLGIHLISQNEVTSAPQIAMSSSEVEYLKPVYPGEQVMVKSIKKYFRFGKLKCLVSMYNTKEELVCKGTISGMIIAQKNEA